MYKKKKKKVQTQVSVRDEIKSIDLSISLSAGESMSVCHINLCFFSGTVKVPETKCQPDIDSESHENKGQQVKEVEIDNANLKNSKSQ